jgi:glutamyl-tRNA reductase
VTSRPATNFRLVEYMTQEFIVLHRSGPDRYRLRDEVVAFSFMTCLRHVVIAEESVIADLAPQGGDVLRGEEAYRFVLEVICGLHSPLIGETEVAGQFKNAVAAFSSPSGSFLAKIFKALFEDAKKIRDAHLKDLGSQSYGSVLRREIRGLKNVHILGAGHLVQEILPWVMKDGLQLTIHVRDVVKASRELAEKLGADTFAKLRVSPIGARAEKCDALVIAAPVSSEFVSSWSSGAGFVADLRADSAVDRLTGFDRSLELGAFMSRLTENQTFVVERKRLALEAIAKAALERARTVEYRPFGWEDVCA